MERKDIYKLKEEQYKKIEGLKNIQYVDEKSDSKITILIQKEKFKYDFYNYLLKNEK